MEGVEHEICNNCKKEIPQHNYVMHTMHCARNIALCKVCKEPIPKSQIVDHENMCKPKMRKPSPPPPSLLEKSSYFQTRKAIEDKKAEDRKERYMQRMDRLVDSGYSLKNNSSNSSQYTSNSSQYTSNSTQYTPTVMDRSSGSRFSGYATPVQQNGFTSPFKPEMPSERPPQNTTNFSRPEPAPIRSNSTPSAPTGAIKKPEPVKSSGMLECKYCDLELPKLDLEEHETYCGTRTDKCLECGELVMFRDKQSHMDSNHPQLKRRGRNPPPAWDSAIPRSEGSALDPPQRRRPQLSPLATFDYDPMPYLPSNYQAPTGTKKKEGENYKDISRRLDCKTEYIRNLLHDSASITIPLRRTATAPRNRFNHSLSSVPSFTVPVYTPSPAYRRRNPPTELVIPCEFCGVPVPHEDLIEHETGCRPDLARFNPRRRVLSPEPDDYNDSPPQPSSPEVELPCEFCGDMIPASQLLGHQVRCN